jgi:hypothetical protein
LVLNFAAVLELDSQQEWRASFHCGLRVPSVQEVPAIIDTHEGDGAALTTDTHSTGWRGVLARSNLQRSDDRIAAGNAGGEAEDLRAAVSKAQNCVRERG